MRKMFRTAAVVLCGAGLAVSASMIQAAAQDTTPPASADGQQPAPGGRQGWSPEQRAEMLQKRLNLSDDQTAQVKTILTNSQTQMEALRANTSLAEQDRRAQARTLRQSQQAQIRAVLTPEQQTMFDQMQAQHHGRRGGGMNEEPAPSQEPQM